MRPATWLPLLIVVLLMGAVFQLPWLITFAVAVMVVIASAAWWNHHALDHIHYVRRWHFKRGFPGEQTRVRIGIENRKFLPITWLRALDPWPLGVPPKDSSVLARSHIHDEGLLVNLCSLRWFERVWRSYELIFGKRGVYPVGPVTLESGDLFGLYENSRQQGSCEYLTVFPELLNLPKLKISTEDPFGDKKARRRLFEDPLKPIGIRSYQPSDEFRRIHWQATARTGELQVKTYQAVSSQVLMVCLNVSTATQPWMGFRSETLEQLVKLAATVVYQGIQDGYSVGLISNGYLAYSDHPFQIAPGRSSEHLATLLQALASVAAQTSSSFETFLSTNLPRVPFGASLVIITALVTPSLSETLLRLKRYRAHTTLISINTTAPPQLPGIRCLHLPFQDEGEKTK